MVKLSLQKKNHRFLTSRGKSDLVDACLIGLCFKSARRIDIATHLLITLKEPMIMRTNIAMLDVMHCFLH